MKHKFIIGLVGEKLAGKGEIAAYLEKKYQAKKYRVSKILDEILSRLYLPNEREKEIALATGIRSQLGEDVFVQTLKRDIAKEENPLVIIDGIRLPKEVEVLKSLPNFILVYVVASVVERYERAKMRKEKEGENELSFEQFKLVENGITEKHIMDIGKNAEITIFNDKDLSDLHRQIEDKIIGRINQREVVNHQIGIAEKVKIRRIDKSLPLPAYQTKGSVGFDLYCREAAIINPGEVRLLGVNVNIETPEGYMLAVLPRSSTPRKKGLAIPNGFGVIDQDYAGNSDEVLIQFFNFGKELVSVEKGERLAQGVFVKIGKLEWVETDDMGNDNRGGVGSTERKDVNGCKQQNQEIEDFLQSVLPDDEFSSLPVDDLDF